MIGLFLLQSYIFTHFCHFFILTVYTAVVEDRQTTFDWDPIQKAVFKYSLNELNELEKCPS